MKKDTLILDPSQIKYISSLVEGGGVAPLNVTGNSMRPFISPKGDTVFLVQCKKDEIKKGDVILFRRNNGSVVLHRVRRIEGDTYIMNGDAQNWCESITYDNVVAKMIEYIHNGKRKDPESISQRIIHALWYPTFRLRPYIIKGFEILHILK